mgnify:CR=1 FL=1
MAYYANVYELDRRYGGDEEGGWWFTTFPSSGTIARKACKDGNFLEIFPKSVEPFYVLSK